MTVREKRRNISASISPAPNKNRLNHTLMKTKYALLGLLTIGHPGIPESHKLAPRDIDSGVIETLL